MEAKVCSVENEIFVFFIDRDNCVYSVIANTWNPVTVPIDIYAASLSVTTCGDSIC